uniref:Uncharacterized protein n=1 Tax=Ditylenchus dipsaci TaxID=166011 RepID=A0A915EKE4_9BILA
MPKLIYYAPPITLHLRDKRSFGRKPLVGSAIISNFSRFIQKDKPSAQTSAKESNWKSYEEIMFEEDKILQKELFDFDINGQSDRQDIFSEQSSVLKA